MDAKLDGQEEKERKKKKDGCATTIPHPVGMAAALHTHVNART